MLKMNPQINDSYPLKFDSFQVNWLKFAEDLLILTGNKRRLSKNLNNLEDCCDKWQIALPVYKTNALFCKKKKPKTRNTII